MLAFAAGFVTAIVLMGVALAWLALREIDKNLTDIFKDR